MTKPKVLIFKYWVPIIALVIVAVHFFLTKTTNLNSWKGGGFGMYSEVHYYFYDLVIEDLNKPLDELVKEDKSIDQFVMVVKRSPNDQNLHRMAELAFKYVSSDTVTIQIWKPLIDSKNSTYSRELINEYQFIKP